MSLWHQGVHNRFFPCMEATLGQDCSSDTGSLLQERKDASQKQNKKLKSQANLQNRKKQEKLQKERRKKDLLAITFQREVPRLGLGRMAGGDVRHLQTSESSDNLQHHQLQHPDHGDHGDHGQHSQRHVAKVHSDQAEGGGSSNLSRREGGERKTGGAEAEARRERIEKVEQTTVHTVITRQEKLSHPPEYPGHSRHLPALHTGDQPAVHGAVRQGRQDRQGSVSGSDNGGDQLARHRGGAEARHRHSDGGGGGGGGVPHLRSLVRADPLESRAGEGGGRGERNVEDVCCRWSEDRDTQDEDEREREEAEETGPGEKRGKECKTEQR